MSVTTLLGIAGAFVATYLGHAIGWYQPGQGAGLIGAIVGAIIVLAVWGHVAIPEGCEGRSSRKALSEAPALTQGESQAKRVK